MEQNQIKTLTVDGVEYEIEKLSDESKLLLNHIADLDNKAAGFEFQLQQVRVGRDAFFGLLKQSLQAKPEQAEEVEVA